MELPLKVMANTRYIIIPFFAFRIIFPLIWGIILFVLVYSLRAAEKSNRTARMIIEAGFFIANVASVVVNFYKLFAFTSYTLILTGLLCAGIIFEMNQVFKSKREPVAAALEQPLINPLQTGPADVLPACNPEDTLF